MKKKILLLLAFAVGISMWGCYTNTIDSLSTFKFQLPIYFYSNWENKAAPDTSWDYTDLEDYPEYNDNKDKIQVAELISFNYWLDSLITDDGVPFDPTDPDAPEIEFDFIEFYLVFADEFGNRDPNAPEYLLGKFTNVNAKTYWRNPAHILEVPSDVAKIASVAIKDYPQFYIKSVYSKTKGQTEPYRYFPLIHARFDIVIRFEVSL